jgi:hypothetical protein
MQIRVNRRYAPGSHEGDYRWPILREKCPEVVLPPP